VADHHKKGGSKAKAGQTATAKNGPGPRASQEAAKQKLAAKLGGQESKPVKPTGKIGLDLPMGMP
jgi:hypothetical protein